MPKTPRAILLIFCLLLIVPAMGQWLDLDPFARHTENRQLAERPQLAWSWAAIRKFPEQYQTYCNDHFGFRNTLVRGNFVVRYGMLGVSTSSRVVAGKEGWLYYNDEGEMDDCLGITRFSEDQLRQLAQVFTLKRDLLARQGIRYLLVIPPNKCTVYPEHLPEAYQRVRPESGLDEFVDHMQRHTDLEIVNLRGVLLEEKREQTLYLLTDTHWNTHGAFRAYREMLKPLAAWFPTIKPLELGDFDIRQDMPSGGDMAGMLGGKEFLNEQDYTFTPKKPFSAVKVKKNETYLDPFIMMVPNPALPRAVIFRDSYFTAMTPFAAEHFSLSLFIWSRWDGRFPMTTVLAQYQPQVVIEEIAERYLKNVL